VRKATVKVWMRERAGAVEEAVPVDGFVVGPFVVHRRMERNQVFLTWCEAKEWRISHVATGAFFGDEFDFAGKAAAVAGAKRLVGLGLNWDVPVSAFKRWPKSRKELVKGALRGTP